LDRSEDIELKNLFYTILLLSLFGCGSLTKNTTKEGKLLLRGGVFQGQTWEDRLSFKRHSWFKELTLVFDLMMVRIDRHGPYYNWFSSGEKQVLSECDDAFVAVTYAQDQKKIGQGMFYDQMSEAGYSRFSLATFSRHLTMHPDYEALSLQLYTVEGMCRKEASDRPRQIRFPGFKEIFL
jgi:hypothetical protein